MKKAVVISAAYVGFFLISLTLLGALVLIYTWISNYSPEYQSQSFFQPLIKTLLYSLPAATALSLMSVLLFRTRTRERAPLQSIAISILAIALYAGGGMFLLHMSKTTASTDSHALPFYQQRLAQIGRTILYTGQINVSPQAQAAHLGEQDSALITPLLTVDMNTQQPPRFSFYPEGWAFPEQQVIRDDQENRIFEYTSSTSPFYAFAEPPEFIRTLVQEVGGIVESLRQSIDKGWIYLLITSAAHVLFLTASWSLIRSSRWPLLNALLALIFLRGFFFLNAAFHSGIFAELLQVLSLESYVFLAPSIAFIVMALLFALWGLVHNPAPKGAKNE